MVKAHVLQLCKGLLCGCWQWRGRWRVRGLDTRTKFMSEAFYQFELCGMQCQAAYRLVQGMGSADRPCCKGMSARHA